MKPQERGVFFLAWAVWAGFLAGLLSMLCFAYFQQDRLGAIVRLEFSIIQLRTFGYAFAIGLFPIIGAIRRRIQSQIPTMRRTSENRLFNRDLAGLILGLALAESIGIAGFLLFQVGDDLNTLYIFVGLSALAMILHRPKLDFVEEPVDCGRESN